MSGLKLNPKFWYIDFRNGKFIVTGRPKFYNSPEDITQNSILEMIQQRKHYIFNKDLYERNTSEIARAMSELLDV